MDKQKLKKFGREFSIPIVLLIVYFIIFYVQKIIPVPSQESSVNWVLNFIDGQSIGLIFLIALVEGALIVGQYAPGGIVIFLSFLSAQGDILRLALLVLVVSFAFIIAYSLNYLLGYYGINN